MVDLDQDPVIVLCTWILTQTQHGTWETNQAQLG